MTRRKRKRDGKPRSLGDQLRNARFAALECRAVSDNANQLVDHLTDHIAKWEIRYGQRKRRRRAGTEKLRTAMTGLLGDLLLARRPEDKANGWVYRSMQAQGFTGKRVSHRTFASVVDAVKDLGLVEHKAGVFFLGPGFDGGQSVDRRFAARLRATPKLLKVCREHGITDANTTEHFIERLPEDPLVLRATSRRVNGTKERGKLIKFEFTPKTGKLKHQVRRINEFLDRCVIRGGTHRYFVRQFNNGDAPDFNWNKGGRLYSSGDDSYQQLPGNERLRMTIDGEVVSEIDVRASYLTILHARHKAPFNCSQEHDPYVVAGLDRSVVKAWVAVLLGSKKAPQRWPKETADRYAAEHKGRKLSKDFPIKKVGALVMESIPLLARWTDLQETWADLMWLESEAVIASILELMEKNIPSLPVHDSLLVPASRAEVAREVLSRHYQRVSGVAPVLRVHEGA